MIDVRVDVDTVDGSEILKKPLEVSSLSHYFLLVLYIPSGAGFLSSRVSVVYPTNYFFLSDFLNMPT